MIWPPTFSYARQHAEEISTHSGYTFVKDLSPELNARSRKISVPELESPGMNDCRLVRPPVDSVLWSSVRNEKMDAAPTRETQSPRPVGQSGKPKVLRSFTKSAGQILPEVNLSSRHNLFVLVVLSAVWWLSLVPYLHA